MDWTLYPERSSDHGLSALVARAEAEFGEYGKLTGLTFLHDAREMMKITRAIELDSWASAGPLYVGFQTMEKASLEAGRYRGGRQSGLVVYGFGTGVTTQADDLGLDEWAGLPADRQKLENQWYLVRRGPEPIAFVGWEISEDSLWGLHGISAPGKNFTGFISDDVRLVEAIASYLDGVKSAYALTTSRGPLPRWDSKKRVLLVIDSTDDQRVQRAIDRVTLAYGSLHDIYLYDTTTGSFLSTPYPENDSTWLRPLDTEELRSLGRHELGSLIARLTGRGISAKAILAEKPGLSQVPDWCNSLEIELLVLPEKVTKPGLFDRLRGFSLEAIKEKVSTQIILS